MSSYSVKSFDVQAGEQLSIAATGRVVAALDLSGPDAIKLRIGNEPPQYFTRGITIRTAEPFKGLELVNDTATAAAVQLAWGQGDIVDNRLNVLDAIDVSFEAPALLKTTADVSCAATSTTKVLNANAKRNEAYLSNLSGATLRVGDANAGASRGIVLPADSTIFLTTQDDVHVYNPSASAVDVALGETERS